MEDTPRKYSVQLSFEEVRLPPFEDILILGKKCPQGKIGVNKSFEFLVPNEYEVIETPDDIIEAVFINKKVLKKMPHEKILDILKVKVFPFVSECEVVKVDFNVCVSYESISGEF